ncbi:cupin domain-containing protein [Nocardia sp. XZ_19_385]|uniref:cupin domain-containing protein n=1 Tax=Nocardia sp. XZ_19_385 TaxID=2769488 RepID=UPI00188DF8F4|nr:cupin domain-containing protein [Nocardia sp. XZ_19_385]
MPAELTGPTRATHIDEIAAADIGPGIQVRELPGTIGIRPWVIDLAPGAEWPDIDVHTTYGEAYYVIEGTVRDGDKDYGPGSYLFFEPGTSHRPSTETGARAFGFNYDQPKVP